MPSIVNFSSWLQRLGFTEPVQPQTVLAAQPVRVVADDRPHVGPVVGPSGLIGCSVMSGGTITPGVNQNPVIQVSCFAPGGMEVEIVAGGLNGVGPISAILQDAKLAAAYIQGPSDLDSMPFNGSQGAGNKPLFHDFLAEVGTVTLAVPAAIGPSWEALRAPTMIPRIYVPPGQVLIVRNHASNTPFHCFIRYVEFPATELFYGTRGRKTAAEL